MRLWLRVILQWSLAQIDELGVWWSNLGISDRPIVELDPAAGPEEDGEGLFEGYIPHRSDLTGEVSPY